MRRVMRVLGLMVLVVLGLLVVASAALMVSNPEPATSLGWERLADLPAGRGEVAASVVSAANRDRLVVAGGFQAPFGRTTDAVHAFDPEADEWTPLAPLPAARHHAAAASIGDTVYVSGGAASALDWSPRTDLWVLRPGAPAWESLPPMPEGRSGHRMETVDGLLFVIGGDGPSGRVLVYDPDAAAWSTGAEMPVPRDHLGSAVVQAAIWAIGGRADGNELVARVDIYDPSTDSWDEGPALPVAMSAGVVGALDGSVHVVGGEDPRAVRGGVIARHLVLPPGADEWEDGSLPILDVHGAGGGVVDGRLLISGGARRQGILSLLSWTGVTQAYAP